MLAPVPPNARLFSALSRPRVALVIPTLNEDGPKNKMAYFKIRRLTS